MRPRRWYTAGLVGVLGLGLTGCCGAFGYCEDDAKGSLGRVGCRAASYGAASGYGERIGNTFGDQHYDQKMTEEVAIQRGFFGIPTTVVVLYEGDPSEKNAYATPDGYILFGYYMFFYTIGSYGELAAAGVLAHEWGHRAQYTQGWVLPNPAMELEADAFSGFYMALAKQWAWSQIEGYYANVYAAGDYNFNHPAHHGTPQQRLAAAYLGVSTALAAAQTGHRYSYSELHTIFLQGISGNVLKSPEPPAGLIRLRPGVSGPTISQADIDELLAGRRIERNLRVPSLSSEQVRKLSPGGRVGGEPRLPSDRGKPPREGLRQGVPGIGEGMVRRSAPVVTERGLRGRRVVVSVRRHRPMPVVAGGGHRVAP